MPTFKLVFEAERLDDSHHVSLMRQEEVEATNEMCAIIKLYDDYQQIKVLEVVEVENVIR